MISWFQSNMGTIMVSAVLLGIAIAVVVVIVRDKKKGKSSCGGKCGHCPMGTSCHGHN